MKYITVLFFVTFMLAACGPEEADGPAENTEKVISEIGKWDDNKSTWDGSIFGE